MPMRRYRTQEVAGSSPASSIASTFQQRAGHSERAVDVARTCPGHCCVAFYLPTPHDRVDEIAEGMHDGEVIAEMVIPLSLSAANERLERFGAEREYGPESEGHVYTCRNFDEETRLCRIYEQRPEMCRDYPYGNDAGCEYECGYCAPLPVVAKWTLLTAMPRRICPRREPMSQR